MVILRRPPRPRHRFTSEVPKTLMTIESGLNDCETESKCWHERGETAKMEDVFEAFRYRERPLLYMPVSDGAIFCITVLGRTALDRGTYTGYVGDQGHTLYEDCYGGRRSWDVNHAVVRVRMARVETKQELV